MSAPKRLFIFYNSFSLQLTENLHKQKHDLHLLFIIFFSKMYNKQIYLSKDDTLNGVTVQQMQPTLIAKKSCFFCLV